MMTRELNRTKTTMQAENRRQNAERVIREFTAMLRKHLDRKPSDATIYSTLVVAYWTARGDIGDMRSFMNYVDNIPNDGIRTFIETNIEDMWHIGLRMSHIYKADSLKDALSCFPYTWKTDGYILPDDVVSVAADILACGNTDDRCSFADLYCGYGKLLSEIHKKKPGWSLFGMESESVPKTVAEITADIDGMNVAFNTELPDADTKFDRIFCNLIRGKNNCHWINSAGEFLVMFSNLDGLLPVCDNSEWNVVAEVMHRLTDSGKAVIVIPSRILKNRGTGRDMRKMLVESGCIKAAISIMPDDHPSYLGTSMIVLSKDGGGDSIRMTNIQSLKLFLDECGHACGIGDALFSGAFPEICAKHMPEFSQAELAERNYMIFPDRYLVTYDENTVQFGSIMQNMMRGIQMPTDNMKAHRSDEPTDCQYVTLSNIQDGMLSGNMQYLKNISPSMEKYFLHDRDLIITKSNTTVKTAVVSAEPEKKFLLSGNLYAVRIDESKANPYYIKAYLESRQGAEALARIMTGSVVHNISTEDMKNLRIPMQPLESQKCFEKAYRDRLKKISTAKEKLAEMISNMNCMYESYGWGDNQSLQEGTEK